jgi:site-specific recombinase XerD
MNSSKRARWLQVLLTFIIPTDIIIPSTYKKNSYHSTDREDDDGSDHHRISSKDLDKIYEQSMKNTKHELLYLLMITTGLRVGGTAHILTQYVADIVDDQYEVRIQGRTKEKGHKWANFMLTPRVQDLLGIWLKTERPADPSPYLFPGREGGSITTESICRVFHDMCTTAGLKGKQFHPHALRHSYAHILLETGNKVETTKSCK